MSEYVPEVGDVVRFANANPWNLETTYRIADVTSTEITFTVHHSPNVSLTDEEKGLLRYTQPRETVLNDLQPVKVE